MDEPNWLDNRYDYPEPFDCIWCGADSEAHHHYPYCSPDCALAAERENELDEIYEVGGLPEDDYYDA